MTLKPKRMDSTSGFIPRDNIKSLLGLKGRFGDICADVVMALASIHRINRIFRPLDSLKGFEFAGGAIRELDVRPVINEDELSLIPEIGPFIICSNHPFGCIDGLIMISAIGKIRPDVRFMTNFILSQIPCLQELFIPVDPFSKGAVRSVKGVRSALEHLKAGHPLVIFPAGEVSSNRNPEHVVKDIEWDRGSARLIERAGVPVIPAYFDGSNSKYFHFLGGIHPFLRTLRLPAEMLNKRGREIILKFGKAVSPSEFKRFGAPEQLASYLRNRTYALEGTRTGTGYAVPEKNSSAIAPHIDPAILHAELECLESGILYKEGGYTCYVNRYEEIPNIIQEIGVCREETFRQNGEGTGNSTDLDEYDKYYLHLHLWHDGTRELVGAYRVGVGTEIMKSKGIRGFYTDSFFHYKDEFGPILEQSLELGRSFIVPKFQIVPNALKMLLHKGIGTLSLRYPAARYLFGAASISSEMPKLFSSIMVEYFKRAMYDRDLGGLTASDNPFVPEFCRMDIDALNLETLTPDQFDRLLSRLSGGRYRMPALMRAYAKSNCKFIGFNIDHNFGDCTDALLLVDLRNIGN